jgi:hypothetical protein
MPVSSFVAVVLCFRVFMDEMAKNDGAIKGKTERERESESEHHAGHCQHNSLL